MNKNNDAFLERMNEIVRVKSGVAKGKRFAPVVILLEDGVVVKESESMKLQVYHQGDYKTYQFRESWNRHTHGPLQVYIDEHITMEQSEEFDKIVILTPTQLIITKQLPLNERYKLHIDDVRIEFPRERSTPLEQNYRVVLHASSMSDLGADVI